METLLSNGDLDGEATIEPFFPRMNDKELASSIVQKTVNQSECFIHANWQMKQTNPVTQMPCILMSWDYLQKPHHELKQIYTHRITAVSPEWVIML